MEVGIFVFFVIPAVFAFLYIRYRMWLQQREEDYYFDRLYWTMRQAQEDSKNDDNKTE